MSVIYHLATREDWRRAQNLGVYSADSLEDEGFIHCSYGDQHADVANRLFAGRRDLLLLLLEAENLPMRIENGFPHVYGPIDLSTVFEIAEYQPAEHGRFEPYEEASGFETFGRWRTEDVARRASDAMTGYTPPWGVAGGWAIDLFLGARTRPHADLEFVVRYADQAAIFDHLRDWDARLVTGHGILETWDGRDVGSLHQVWARRGADPAPTWREFAADPTMIDFLFEPSDGDEWICRRNEGIHRPIKEMLAVTDGGIPYVRPEIVLLFKAKYMRFKDQRDFDRVLPHLDEDARAWLREALDIVHPDHAWLEPLQQVRA